MLKKRLFIVVFLLFLPSVFSLMNTTLSAEESLYTGTVKDGEKVTADSFEFEFSIASEGGVLIKYDGQGIIIMEDTCKYKDNLHICVGDISWSHRNLTIWKDIYQAVIDISVVKGVLGITRDIEKTKLLIEEESKIEALLENTGSREIQNVVFRDSYPGSIMIKDIEGCSFGSNNSVEWKGNIPPKVIEKCSYTLVGLKAVEYESKAEASYFDGIAIENAYSDEVEIEVKNYSLKVTPSLNKDKLEIGSFVNLSIALKNINEDEKISVWSFKVDVPTGLKIVKRKGLTKDGQTLSWRGDLESDEEKNFTIDFLAERAGNNIIYLKEDYKVGKFRREFIKSLNVNVYCDCLFIRHKLSGKIAGRESDFKVYLFNPSYENKFNDIKMNVFTDVPGAEEFSKTYPVLDKRQSIILFQAKVKIPEEKSYYYNVSISYKSDYGQHFENEEYILVKGEAIGEAEIAGEIEGEISEAAVIGEEEKETKQVMENLTEEAETIVIDIEDKKLPLILIPVILSFLIIAGIAIGLVKLKKEKKEIEPPPKFGPLLAFLFLIVAVSLFYLLEPSVMGFAVYNIDADFIKSNLSLLGAMVVLFVFLLMVVYRREP